jgi:hypothetical protein
MGLFRAYFDASGDKRMKAMAFAGFVSRVNKWDRFNEEWPAILAREDLKEFRMTDFVSSQGEFKSWRGQTDRRRRFISDLVKCVKRNTNKGFSSSVFVDDYNRINNDFMLAESIGQPYTLCGYACLGALAKWAINKGERKDRILIAVEDGDEDKGELIARAESDGFKVVPLKKAYVTAFQAGDLVGWKCRTVLQEALRLGPQSQEDDRDNILRSLEALEGIVQSNKGFDKASLRALCIAKSIPKRPKVAAAALSG